MNPVRYEPISETFSAVGKRGPRVADAFSIYELRTFAVERDLKAASILKGSRSLFGGRYEGSNSSNSSVSLT